MKTKIVLITLVLVAVTLCASAADSYKFIVTGDSRGDDNGINLQIIQELVTAIIAEDADLVLFSGDLVNDGTTPQLQNWVANFMVPLQNAGVMVYPCRGNHDLLSGDAPWQIAFAGTHLLPQNGPAGELNMTYSFVHKNALFIALDEYVNFFKVNQAWLDDQLKSNTMPHAFVFGHMPAFSVDHPDCLASLPADRDLFWNSLVSGGAYAYFCGHDHFYNHAEIQNANGTWIQQVVAGTAGAPTYNWDGTYGEPARVHGIAHYASKGYSVVEVNGLDVRMTYREYVSPGVFVTKPDTIHYTGRMVGPGMPVATFTGLAALITLIIALFVQLLHRLDIV
jgi:3',5'-cyclic AMP phosphodiesterase CpdA